MVETNAAMAAIRNAILKMDAYVPGEQPSGGPFIKINQNENPYPPSPSIYAAMQAEFEMLPYYGEPSNLVVREAAAEVYGVSPDCVTAVNGSDEILRILCQVCAGEGDRVVAFNPSFTYYKTLAEVQGARYDLVELTADFGLPDPLPDLTDAKLVFLPNPNAPSGTLFSQDDIRRLIAAVPNGLVVVDEAYADFSGVTSIPLLAEYENLVITRTLSKSYALAGLRAGLGIASPDLIKQFNKVRDHYNLDRLTQAGAAAAVRDQEYLRKTVTRICATRDRFVDSLRALGVHVWPSHTNFILARFANSGEAQRILSGLRDRNILVRYFNKPRIDDCLRISIGTEEEMDIVSEAIGELLV